jgi:transposase
VEITRKFKTFYPVLAVMVTWLVENRVTHVTMESTGIYWRPVFHALCETEVDLEILLVNAAHVKNVPGRKTDVKDSQWLAQLLECGLLRGSFIPPKEIAAIREVTRYRKKMTASRVSEVQRLGKVLEDVPLTELPGGHVVSCSWLARRVVTVSCHGRSSGYASGSVVVGSAAAWVG